MKKEYIRCEFDGVKGVCGKPCGQILPNRKVIFYTWAFVRGFRTIREDKLGTGCDYKYYCCIAHYENREKRKNKRYDTEGDEVEDIAPQF